MPDAIELLTALASRVDGFFGDVLGRNQRDMQCRAGCTACCAPNLTITAVEAAWIATDTRPRASAPNPNACPALSAAGECQIYLVRPLVCRSHGLPIRLSNERGLPVISSCELNFRAGWPAASDHLDQTTLSSALWQINQLVDATHRRIPISEALSAVQS